MSKKNEIKNPIFDKKNISKYILPQYNLFDCDISLIKFKNTNKQRIIYKISKKNINYCLKKVYYDESNLLYIYSALEWLYRSNISVPRLMPTISCNRFSKAFDKFFILTPWINGDKCNFDNVLHLFNSIETLAYIHKTSKDFTPIKGSFPRKGLSNLYIQTLKHFEDLNRISSLAINLNDSFSNYFIKNFEANNFLAEKSLEVSAKISYENLSKSLTHGDYVNKNIIISNTKTSVIDFDKCKYDFISHDISYFLRRLLKRNSTKWDFKLFISLLKKYNNIYTLNEDDIKYIVSYVSFPQKYFKLSKSYYSDKNFYGNKNLKDKRLNSSIDRCEIEKIFKKSLQALPYQINFVNNAINYFKNTKWKL